MSFFDGMKGKVAEWFFMKEWPVFVRGAALFLVGHLTTGHAGQILGMFGVTIDPTRFISAFVAIGTGAAVVGALHLGWEWIAQFMQKKAQ